MKLNPLNFVFFCTCADPTWVAGMTYVDPADAESVHAERMRKQLPPMRCESCDRPYHPDVSFNPYG